MGPQTTLILDIMGADRGTAEMLRGAAEFARSDAGRGSKLVVVSAEPDATRAQVRDALEPALQAGGGGVEVLPAEPLPSSDGFTAPLDVFKRYPRCSIRVAMEAAKAIGPAAAVVSPGTTGLVMASATFTLGRVKGIARPPIGTPMPTYTGDMIFLDGGSNVDCKPEHLHQFAVLGGAYVRAMKGIARPTVALLSNGSEEYKGNVQVREAWDLLKADQQLNFVGYTEGHTMLSGELDVMICDGFLGNIVLKVAEGIAEMFSTQMRAEIKRRPLAAVAAQLTMQPVFRTLRKRMDYAQFGGAPLLGLNGNVMICHGRSNATAIRNALTISRRMAETGVIAEVAKAVASHEWGGNGSG
jgi:glycerol-3-phosphate acyltransferase PlsX